MTHLGANIRTGVHPDTALSVLSRKHHEVDAQPLQHARGNQAREPAPMLVTWCFDSELHVRAPASAGNAVPAANVFKYPAAKDGGCVVC